MVYSVSPNSGKQKLPAAAFGYSKRARLRVRASDGFYETAKSSAAFSAKGVPPKVKLENLPPKTRVDADGALIASATAFDDATRPVTGKRITWFVDGKRVARGGQVALRDLRPGRRKLRVVATDSNGREGAAKTSVTVVSVKPLFLTFKAPKKISRSAKSVKVTVASSVVAKLQAGGKTFKVSRKSRTLRWPVLKPGRKTLLLPVVLKAGSKSMKATYVADR